MQLFAVRGRNLQMHFREHDERKLIENFNLQNLAKTIFRQTNSRFKKTGINLSDLKRLA